MSIVTNQADICLPVTMINIFYFMKRTEIIWKTCLLGQEKWDTGLPLCEVTQTKLHENQIKSAGEGRETRQNTKVSVLGRLSRSLAHQGTVNAFLKEVLCSQMLKLD